MVQTAIAPGVTTERLREMYRLMLTERRLGEQHAKWNKLHGFKTTGARLGTEGIATGVCTALRRRADVGPNAPVDLVCGVYGRIHMGCSLEGIFAEMLGRSTGYTKGIGGNNHFIAVEYGLMGTGGIVGAPIPQAVGMAWGVKQDKTGQVVACFFGDGASNTGMFHEGLNLASLYKVPVIFVCVNNGYSISTPTRQSTSVDRIAKRAAAYDMVGVTVDGTDVLAVHQATREAAERGRSGNGPTLLECKFYRPHGYGPDDNRSVSTADELDFIRNNDPVAKFRRVLEERGVFGAGEFDQIDAEVLAEIDKALAWALDQPPANPESMYAEFMYPPNR